MRKFLQIATLFLVALFLGLSGCAEVADVSFGSNSAPLFGVYEARACTSYFDYDSGGEKKFRQVWFVQLPESSGKLALWLIAYDIASPDVLREDPPLQAPNGPVAVRNYTREGSNIFFRGWSSDYRLHEVRIEDNAMLEGTMRTRSMGQEITRDMTFVCKAPSFDAYRFVRRLPPANSFDLIKITG